ncbi:tyrosine-type recombinase/integrase [Pseudonocardia pini]|uniref:tyrosine-type recombinase/integrase n=1 Tax=Pseudonocardia pini TaxID=2758030 RepID=UPI0015F0F224|nr:site-specific integrase [Pseudonocardia pini]
MARPMLPIGTHGNINTTLISPAGTPRSDQVWEARCRFRDYDGHTRPVRRTGRSKTAAENALKVALAERRPTAGAVLTGDSRLSDAGRLWLEKREQEATDGEISLNTPGQYEVAWRLHVEPSMGGLRLREITVARCEAWLQELRKHRSASTAKTAKTVLSGILGYAARMGAMPANPVRDTSPVPRTTKRKPRALTRVERTTWLAKLEESDKARRWDLPDLTRMMLATGGRVGEVLALSWDDVEFDTSRVWLRARLIRVAGLGLIREDGTKGTRAAATVKARRLKLPTWAMDVLRVRQLDPDHARSIAVFPDSKGGWRDPSNTLRVLRQERAGIEGLDWVHTHAFRKTALTHLDTKQLTARQVADVAGHADPSMTQRVYLVRDDVHDEAADALEDLL